MSSLKTLARPYAKAAFELAQEQGALQAWDDMLQLAASISGDERVARLIGNPEVGAGQVVALICDAAGDNFDVRFRGYLSVLADNERLPLLGEIRSAFGQLRLQAERRLVVRVVSAVELDDDQRKRMKHALSRRFDVDVQLENEIDTSVIGGAVVYAGDEVIDGSLRGRLRKLEQSLVS